VTPLAGELTRVSAFFLKSWLMTRRNVMTIFEVVFWPTVGLVSVGLMTAFLGLAPGTTVFVLVGTVAFSVVQVCQIDVAYAVLLDMWGKSVKHQFLAPVRPWHIVLGAWLMGICRALAVFGLMSAVGAWLFGVSFLAPGLVGTGTFLLGLVLCAAGIGLLVGALLLLFGVHAEVTAWSGVSLILLLCGIYYPVSLLPAPLGAVAAVIPLTHFLEGYRGYYGFEPVFRYPVLWGFLLALAYLGLGYAVFGWAVERARRTGMLLRLSD
jgi:ABC-2 type transport system permease protein